MVTTYSTMIYAGVFFLFIFLSGFLLSRSGEPYNGITFNIHKLIGVGLGIFLILTVYRTNQVIPLGGAQWSIIALTVLLFALAITAGGLLSVIAEGGLKNISQPMESAITLIHKVFPYLILLSTGGTLYLLLYWK